MGVAFNPNRHHRRSIRLKHHDYTSAGFYFITICTHQRRCLLGNVMEGAVQLSEFGEIVAACWQAIPQHFSQIQLDRFVVMPNHLHGILVVTDMDKGMVVTTDTGRGMAMPCPYTTFQSRKFGQPISGSISTIVGSFKSAVTKQINLLRHAPGTPVWQRNYYEHIIRDDRALHQIRDYIEHNPITWNQDQLHPNHLE